MIKLHFGVLLCVKHVHTFTHMYFAYVFRGMTKMFAFKNIIDILTQYGHFHLDPKNISKIIIQRALLRGTTSQTILPLLYCIIFGVCH